MTGEEYREIIADLGLTQAAAASFLGIDERTARRWIANDHPIPLAVELLLHVMAKKKLTVDTVNDCL